MRQIDQSHPAAGGPPVIGNEEAIEKIRQKRVTFEAFGRPEIVSATAKFKGKLVYSGGLEDEKIRKALATAMIDSGRKFVVTLKLLDGTKQRFRGNGSRIA